MRRGIISTVALALLTIATPSCDQLGEKLGLSKPTVVGGYGEMRSLEEGEQEIFDKATASLEGVEYKPIKVATQVVAGINYRFYCKGWRIDSNGKRGKRFKAQITIYKPLPNQGEPRITQIERQQ